MNCNIFIVLIVLVCLSTTTHSQVQTRWLLQKLDNFQETSRLWYNRYFINEEFALPNGPLFIFVNSGENIDFQWLTHGLIYGMAATHNGTLMSLEPRFYGESRPTFDTSVDSLQYLLHNQTLCDLENFILHFKAQANYTESKVFLWGEGFGASYAVWMKYKFPELIDGVFASNARLQSVYPGYPDYFNNFAETLRTVGGDQCFEQFHSTTQDIDHLITTNNTGEIEREFLLCFPIDTQNHLDIAVFVGFLLRTIDNTLRRSNNAFIQEFCDRITVTDNQSNIAALAAWMRAEFHIENCVMVNYQSVLPNLRSTSWQSITTYPIGLRQWYWQLCSEVATFRTTETASSILFPGRLSAARYQDLCQALFNQRFPPEVTAEGARIINARYGGSNVVVPNVYFTNSELNSFRNLGPSHDVNNEPRSNSFPDGQLSDLRNFNLSDSDPLRWIKIDIYILVSQWIQGS